jgi:autotransporter translocation and assembly factor TamB
VRKGIRKTLLWIGGIVIFLCAAVVLIIGTESGTRWVLHQAVGYVDGLETRDIRGTLLTKLEFGYLGFSSPDAALELTDIEIDFAWSRSSRRRIVLQQLSVGEIRYQSLAVADNEGQPLEIMIPDISIALFADTINVQMVIVDEALVAEVAISTLDLNNEGLRIAEAAASFAEIETGISDLSIRFDDDLSVAGHIEWQYLGGEWSGNASIDGTLRQLRFQHELLQPYVVSASGSVKLLDQMEPVIDATIRINDWRYEEWTVAEGELIINGTTSDYQAMGTATVMTAMPTGQELSAEIQAKGNGSSEGIGDFEVTAQSSLGLVAAGGSIAWLPEPMIDLQITGTDIDPSDFLTLAPGKFDARISLLATSPSDFSVDVASLDGTYNNQPVRAHGKFSAVDAAFLCTACELSVGQNNITIDGSLN